MGTYTCTAFSARGETSWTATLTVAEKSANSNSMTPPDPSKLPEPPGTPRILNVTSSSVTLSWSPSSPKVGIPQIIGYTVEYYSSELQTGWLLGAHRIVSESTTVSSYYLPLCTSCIIEESRLLQIVQITIFSDH